MRTTRRNFIGGAAAIASLGVGGSSLSGVGPAAVDPALADLLAMLSAAKAVEEKAAKPFGVAEERRFSVAREFGHAAGNAEWEAIGGPGLEAVKEAADDDVMAAEDAIREYQPKSFADLVAKARTMPPIVLTEDGEALARDILALAEG